MSVLTIAALTFREASRRKILLAALLLGIAFLVVYSLGFHFITKEIERDLNQMRLLELNEMRNFMLMAGMYVINFLAAIMTVLTSVDTLSGEIATGTIHTLLSKPIRRRDIVIGKWLGFACMITLYLLLMCGGIVGFIYLRSGYTAPHPIRAFILIWLNDMLLLSVSLLGGATLSTLANGVLVFGMYGIAFIGGWIEQIGNLMTGLSASRIAIQIGIITSLLMPSEALWRRAAHEIQSPLVSALGVSPFSSGSYPSILMIGYAVLYACTALFLAIRQFNRRDL